MKYFFVGILLAIVFNIAFADSEPAKKLYYVGGGAGFETPAAACSNAHSNYSYADSAGYMYSGVYYMGYCQANGNNVAQVKMNQTCEGIGGNISGTLPNKICECPPGQKPANGICVQQDPCQTKAGFYDNAGDPQIVQLPGPQGVYTGKAVDGKVPAEICISGCSANPRAGYDYVGAVMKDGTYAVQGNPKYSGASCGDRAKTPDYTPLSKTTPEYDCLSKGQNFGYVNGVVTCTSKTTPTEANGKTNTTTTSNPDGTKTETKIAQSMSCTGAGSCVTTTTTTTTVINADGSRGGSVTRTDYLNTQGTSGNGNSTGPQVDKSDPFCVSNPNSPMCKTGSFSGSCDAQPACEGDPVQCAVAIATWKTDCKTLKPGTPPTDTPAVVEKKVGNQFSATDLPGGSSCPNPRVLTIGGQSIAIEFTPICEFASAIRPVVILLGWIFAGYIVLGRQSRT